MLRISTFVACSFGLLFYHPSAEAHGKFGYFDLKVAILKVCDGQETKRKLLAFKEQSRTLLNRKQNELKQLKKKYDENSNLSAKEKRKARMQMNQKLMELQSSYAHLSRKLAQMEAALTQKIYTKMLRIAKDIASKHKLDFIFEKSGSLFYANPKLNFTKALIKAYNKLYCNSSNKSDDNRLKDLGIDPQ